MSPPSTFLASKNQVVEARDPSPPRLRRGHERTRPAEALAKAAGRGMSRLVGWAKARLRRAHHPRRARQGGHAEPVIGRAFARPVGFAHPTNRAHSDSIFKER